MSTIYSAFGVVVFIALCVSAYRFFRWRTGFARAAFWGCAVALAVLVYADDRFAITQPALQPAQATLTEAEIKSLVATFREAETELKKMPEVDGVTFSTNAETYALEVKVAVNELAGEEFLRDIENETVRTFLHAAVDNWDNPSTLIGGGYENNIFNRLKIRVIVIQQKKKSPSA